MLLDIRNASNELRVGESTLRRWIHQGHVPVVRLGRRVLIRRESLEELIDNAERLTAKRRTRLNQTTEDTLGR